MSAEPWPAKKSSQTELSGSTFEVRYSPVRDRDGEVTGVVGVAVDLVDRSGA